ncbi:hypothetical protein K461DRAFT_318241 [Myriangium duriaei CBS 260.36]|uniref:Ferritin-like domain-containing protein n=1 Tax=Myriangium duriaei CBS 260.36 TaxID=1168546 RepID=A0A9P4MJR6_9PEZI|nr:hypothetical protein K461DRAFT_318241 [Myriangium duriaei CBS 260.36]
MKTFALTSALLAAVVSAAPTSLEKRNTTDIDPTILNYALTLEHLEAAFYHRGLAKFTKADFANAGFKDSRFYTNLKQVAADEATHVSALTATLKAAGQTAVKACKYDFGLTDPASFVDLASVLEGVGVSAYLGAASSITDKDYLTTAGSILTVEARHNAWIRREKNQFPFAQAFDTPLSFNAVYTLASGFITSCPKDNPALPVKAYASLSAGMSTRYHKGDNITFSVKSDSDLPTSDLYIAWPAVTGTIFVAASVENGQVVSTVPKGSAAGPAGQAYALLVKGNTELADENTIAGPAIVNIFV